MFAVFLRLVRLVFSHFMHAPGVTLILAEGRGKEHIQEVNCFLRGMLTGANSSDVGFIVLTGQPRGGLIPDQSGTDTLDQVCCHLFSVAGTAKDDADPILSLGGYGGGAANAYRWVIIVGIERSCPVIDNLPSQCV